MKEISLTKNQVALVDDVNHNWLNQWNWYADYRKSTNSFYAVRNSFQKDGKRHQISMAREILGLKYGDKRQGDHQNHNTLDNRQTNLRISTRSQNQMNRKLVQNTSSKFKGVCWHKQTKKWEAYITINGRRKHLGLWIFEELAALAYDFAALEYHREFAFFNFN